MNKACPGSRAIREPTPEYINCPNCNEEVEVWTHEVSARCPKCGTRVFREQRPSCIDWCPYAKECIGPEVYASLKPDQLEEKAASANSATDILRQEHEEGLKQADALRGAGLCLKIGGLASSSQSTQPLDRGLTSLNNVMKFFDSTLKAHFEKEEELIFPLIEKHIGKQGSPSQMLLGEHGHFWQSYEELKAKVAELEAGGGQQSANDLYEVASRVATLLREHIQKENTSLLALMKGLLRQDELEQIREKWHSVSVKAR